MVEAPCILVADPDPEERARITEILRGLAPAIRPRVLEAADQAALDRHLHVEAVDLVITEALLEGGNGFATLRALTGAAAEGDRTPPPVIMVTHMARELDRYWALRNGAHAFLGKPYDPEHLALRIRKALSGAPRATPERA